MNAPKRDEMIEIITCRGCGRVVVIQQEELSISHEWPQCEWFLALLAKTPPIRSTLVTLDLETGEKVKG